MSVTDIPLYRETYAPLLLTPLALTSSNRMIRWMGARRWQALRRSVYVVAGLAVLHFFWMRAGKHDFAEVAVYAALLGSLLGWRLWRRVQRRTNVRGMINAQER